MPSTPTLLFFGTSPFALPSLLALLEGGFRLDAVLTKPDAPVGRKHLLAPPPVKTEALRHGLSVLQPQKLGPEILKSYHADLGIVVAYGMIIPRSVLALPRCGFVNLHPSLLPRYRGPSPLQTALRDGVAETGVTIMQLNEGVDSGPVYAQEKIPVGASETFETLHERCAERGARLLVHCLPGILDGTLTPRPQDDSESSMTPMLTREHGRIQWADDARAIEQMIRAYTPWPGAWSIVNNQRIKILEARVEDINAVQGEVALMGDDLLVGCGHGALVVTKLQREGKKPMRADEFLRGLHNTSIQFQ